MLAEPPELTCCILVCILPIYSYTASAVLTRLPAPTSVVVFFQVMVTFLSQISNVCRSLAGVATWQHAGHSAHGWAEIDLSKNNHAHYNKSTAVTASTGTIGKPDWQNGMKLHSVGFSDFEEGMAGAHPASWYKVEARL